MKILAKLGSIAVALIFLTPGWTLAAELRSNVEYGRAGGVALLLDARVPETSGPHPVAILVHGGGWSSGDKAGSNHPGDAADISPWFEPLARANFVSFSINYRLAPAYHWPACFDDLQTAIRWAKAHAAEFGGDPTRIALIGHSAGGHLVCLAGTLSGPDVRVQAVVGCAPVTDSEFELPMRHHLLSTSLQHLFDLPAAITPHTLDVLRDTAPIHHVRPGLSPFLLMQGSADRTVPPSETVEFREKLRAAGVPCELITIPGAPHRLLSWAEFDPGWTDKMTVWLRTTLARR